MKRFVAAFLITVASYFSFSGCYGSYALFNKVKDFNGSLGDKWVVSAVHLVLWIVPVYAIAITIDFVLLNTLEFWLGSNPLGMQEGDVEQQLVSYNNNEFMITATKNKFVIKQLTGEKAGKTASMTFKPDEASWYIEANGIEKKVLKYNGSFNEVSLIMPNGDVESRTIR